MSVSSATKSVNDLCLYCKGSGSTFWYKRSSSDVQIFSQKTIPYANNLQVEIAAVLYPVLNKKYLDTEIYISSVEAEIPSSEIILFKI